VQILHLYKTLLHIAIQKYQQNKGLLLLANFPLIKLYNSFLQKLKNSFYQSFNFIIVTNITSPANTNNITTPAYPITCVLVIEEIDNNIGAKITTSAIIIITPITACIKSSNISIHQYFETINSINHLWASLFSKENLCFTGDIFDTPSRDAHLSNCEHTLYLKDSLQYRNDGIAEISSYRLKIKGIPSTPQMAVRTAATPPIIYGTKGCIGAVFISSIELFLIVSRSSCTASVSPTNALLTMFTMVNTKIKEAIVPNKPSMAPILIDWLTSYSRAILLCFNSLYYFLYGVHPDKKENHFLLTSDFLLDAPSHSTNRILSMTTCVFLYTLKQIYIKNNTIGIPSPRGGFERSKTPPNTSQITLTLTLIRFQDYIFIIMVMSSVSLRLSPSFKEYFQLPYNRVYKICNRYKISTITLENFGLNIDQGKPELPKVWSTDSMNINTPSDEKIIDADKPFCCTHCGSENYTKYGKENNKQMYKCKECNRKFVDNLYAERLKGDPKIICITLDLYFRGISLRGISQHLKQFHELNVSYVSIFRWIKRYIDIMDEYVSQFKPKLGTVWHTDEMMVDINGDWYYLWNTIDSFTRFHLASVISKERKIKDARKAFQYAKKRSHGDRPRCIITDGLQTYKKAINKEFHTVKKETIHIGNVGIKGKRFRNTKFDNNMVERLHGTVRDRNKTQRGLKSEETMFVKGHQLYYNFIRPHQGLNGYTPAHFANIYLDLGVNKWENLFNQAMKNKREVTTVDETPQV